MTKTKLLFLTAALCGSSMIFAEGEISKKGDFPPPPNSEMPEMGGMPAHDITKQFDAVVKVESGTKTLKNETIESDEENKNAIFAQNDGKVIAKGITIRTKKNGSRGLYAAFGGTIEAKKVDVETLGEHCAAFATDMGEGSVTVDGGKALTKGKGSPVIYSTGAISVKNLSGSAENSEMAVIEGKNSVTIEKSNLTGGSGLEGEVSAGVMLYQSMSGDANEGTAFFTAKNSKLTNMAKGAFFYVTNTNAVVNLEKTELLGNTDILILASGNNSKRGWGRSGANGGQLEFNLLSQNAKGDIITDKISSVKINLGKKSSLSGRVNAQKQGKVDIFIEKNAKLEITGDSYFNKFADADDTFKNIKSNGHTIFYNKDLEENKALGGRTIILPDCGKLAPTEYDFSLLEIALKETGKGGKGNPPNGSQPPMGNGGMPPQGGMNGGMQLPPDMGEKGNPPPMLKNGGKEPPKPVTMADLKKLRNKIVEVQGIQEKDGSFTVFTITEKK